MIITLTPNPALDLGGVVNGIVPNEKNYVLGETRFPGGNAVNVARWLTRLDLPTNATGFLGGGIGSEIKAMLDNDGLYNFGITSLSFRDLVQDGAAFCV